MVRVAGVTQRYAADVLIPLPDFELGQAEEIALLGPSGSGKSTLLHLLSGLLKASSGEVWVGQQPLHQLAEGPRDTYRRKTIGYLFQDFHLLEGYTALEQVLLGLGIAGVRGRDALLRAKQILSQLELSHRLGHTPRQLSTGERQRVALARAVAHRPSLLLADEPTAHLDRERASDALDLLRQTASSLNAVLLVATHDPWVMEQFPRQLRLDKEPLA